MVASSDASDLKDNLGMMSVGLEFILTADPGQGRGKTNGRVGTGNANVVP